MERARKIEASGGSPTIRALVEGKRVAVVGRAGSIRRAENGPQIDSADVVIRVNWVLPIKADDVRFMGSKTDLVYHCKRAKVARVTAKSFGVKTLQCKRRKASARRNFKKWQRFRPTTGFMAVEQALMGGAHSVHVYGFDLFRSGHSQDREPDGDDYSRPLAWAHSPTQERYAFNLLADRYPNRFFPDKILQGAMKL